MNYSAHIRNRGKSTWQIVIELPPDRLTGKRNRKYKTVKGSKKLAEQVLRKMLYQVETHTYIDSSKITVAECMKNWYELFNADKSPTTLRGYKYQLEHYINPMLGNIPVQSLTTNDVQRWVNSIHKCSPVSKKALSAKTVRNIFLNLSAALDRCVAMDTIAKNPCKNVALPKTTKYEAEIYDEDEISQLIECAKGTDMELLIMLELTLGLRRGELAALRWENIDLEKGIIYIYENRVEGMNGDVITKSPKSNAGKRAIPLSPSLITMLKNHYRKFIEIKLKYNIGRNNDDYVICQPNGLPYKPYSISKKFRTFLEKNNLKHIRFHDLRHTNASIMLSQGISPKVAQQRLGHSDFSTTMNIYSHITRSVENDAAQRLENVLFDKTVNY